MTVAELTVRAQQLWGDRGEIIIKRQWTIAPHYEVRAGGEWHVLDGEGWPRCHAECRQLATDRKE